MSNYFRQISHIFHDYNHTKTKRKCFKNMTSDTILKPSSFPFIIKNSMPGIYTISINGKDYCLNLKYVLTGNDNITIYNNHKATCTINNITSYIQLYECDDIDKYIKGYSIDYTSVFHEYVDKEGYIVATGNNNYIDSYDGRTINMHDTEYYIDNGDRGYNIDKSITDYKIVDSGTGKTIYDSDDYAIFEGDTKLESFDDNTKYYVSIGNGEYVINNTVNDILDCVIFEGNTVLEYSNDKNEQSPYHPAEIKSIDDIFIKSTTLYRSCGSTLPEEEYNLHIRMRNNLKKLTENICDLFVIDSKRKYAYIVYKIGKLILTGTEDIEFIEGSEVNNGVSFFINYQYPTVDAKKEHLISNYFNSFSYNEMVPNMHNMQSGICLSNDIEKIGFFIRIPIDIISNAAIFYNTYTCYILKNNKYTRISTLSKEEIDKIKPEDDNIYILSGDNKYIKLSTAIKDYDNLYKFKKYLSYVYKSNPVTIDYLLADYKYKTELLDEYCIKTFYPKTYLNISCNGGNVSIMTKVLNY